MQALFYAEKYVGLHRLAVEVSIFRCEYLRADLQVFLMVRPVSILGRAKFIQPNEKMTVFNFYNVLGKQMTQCFASISPPISD